eukprot:4380730-Prymnesium_polylepis.2
MLPGQYIGNIENASKPLIERSDGSEAERKCEAAPDFTSIRAVSVHTRPYYAPLAATREPIVH